MNIGEYSVQNRVISWLLVILLVGGGVAAFPGMGKLEDPAYTIKLAKIITFYPGATAEQVQDEVTYHIEDAVQRLGQLKRIKMSISRPGMSDIEIQFKDKYTSKDFPAIYDELRRKISDMMHLLPPGAMAPIVVDDFADVYGTFFAITGDGYTYRDLKDFADGLKKQLVLVPGVRKVEINGAQPEVVYAEISRARLGELGISFEQIAGLLESQNVVSDAGRVDVGSEYIRIHPSGEFTSVKQIGDLLVSSGENQQIYLKDITTIRRAYQEVPDQLIYFNGQPALTLGISMLGGVNVIEVGERLQQRVAELGAQFPAGIELREIYNQPLEVDKSVQGFIVGVGQALAIVIVVLLLFMGLRVGLIIGAVLLITVAGTLWFMSLFGIELQRVSLGALVIALGMLVDNAIVIAEGMLVRMQRGMAAASAARETVGGTIWALLGGTIIGILAFSAIGISQSDTGEFARSLFYVILISLLLSWITAISTTPLLCALLLKPGKKGEGEPADPYAAAPFRIYRSLVGFAIQHRWLTVSVTVGLFVISLYGFTQVKQAFFPQANTPLFFIDVWAPEGTDIRKTRDYTLQIEAFVRQLPDVEDTTAVIGSGATRFTLVYEPKENAAAYAQIIVRTGTREQIEAMPLPPGYTLSWGGEFEDSFEAQDALFKAIPAGFLFMIIATVLLFGKIRQPTIIWLTVPLAIVGITAGLLAFGAFDFMSLLGALSLIGLLIKNAIVLIEEMDQQLATGDKAPLQAVLDSAVSRLRPVALAATTTILGMIPLLKDVFFVNMSITIMAGLGFATLLTLFIIPTLYSIFFGIETKSPTPQAGSTEILAR